MALLFQSDYRVCSCGNKNFFVVGIYAYNKKKNEVEKLNHHLTCTSCNATSIVGLQDIKEESL